MASGRATMHAASAMATWGRRGSAGPSVRWSESTMGRISAADDDDSSTA
jgi:hypothetical protein